MRRTSALSLALAAVGAGAYARQRRTPARRDWSPPIGLDVRTATLAARINGDTGSPVVLLHGLVASGLFWGARYDALARDHRLVVPDLLGFGRSSRPDSGYGPDDHVDALIGCLDELGIAEPATIGAHSLGTLIALRLAETHPDRVAAIVAFGPPLYPDRQTALEHIGATSAMGRLFVLPGRTAELACRWVCDHRDVAAVLAALTHPGLPRAIAADSVQHTWPSYSETLERVILETDVAAALSRVACPVRLIAGDRDPVVDHAFLVQLPAVMPDAVVDRWAGRHDLPLSCVDDCVEAIRASAAALVS